MFYHIYVNNGMIDLSITNEFCNKVLNQHRNNFMSREKRKILVDIEGKMKITKRKHDSVLNRIKMDKIEKYIKTKNYQQLGITEEQFLDEIEKVKDSILNNNKIRKLGIQIDDLLLNFIADEFKICGRLDEVFVTSVINDTETSKFIVKKFEQIKFKFVGNIILTEDEANISLGDKKVEGLNQNNYVIGDNDRYINNVSELLVKLDDDTIIKILNNKDLIKEVVFLLPFLNLIEELDVNTFIHILVDYGRIKDKILCETGISKTVNFMPIFLKRIADLISLANAYSSIDDISLFALGRDIVSEVGEHNSSKYLDFFLQMLQRQNGSIPPITLQTSNYHLESGMYSDPNRLLIGKKPNKNSCIDLLRMAGFTTYNEVLLQNSGDVILIRNLEMKLISRILLFRRGNVIQMVTQSGINYPIDLYKSIADQIIQQAISNHDNIDYVFVNSLSSSSQIDDFICVNDKRFVSKFPHADFLDSAILLSSSKKIQDFDETGLDFNVKPLTLYNKPRKKISYHPTETEITRLCALKIIMEQNLELKETMSRNFEPFLARNYRQVVCGEDWYLAVKKDGTVEEVVLPINDTRILEEIEKTKVTLGINFKKEEISFERESQGLKH